MLLPSEHLLGIPSEAVFPAVNAQQMISLLPGLAQPVITGPTLEASVGFLKETLCVLPEAVLPAKKDDNGYSAQTDCTETTDTHQRGT